MRSTDCRTASVTPISRARCRQSAGPPSRARFGSFALKVRFAALSLAEMRHGKDWWRQGVRHDLWKRRSGKQQVGCGAQEARPPGGGSTGMGRPAGALGGLRRMIVLDTNVPSALMRSTPDPVVIAWLDRQAAESVGLQASPYS